jgi:hypothetical protein
MSRVGCSRLLRPVQSRSVLRGYVLFRYVLFRPIAGWRVPARMMAEATPREMQCHHQEEDGESCDPEELHPAGHRSIVGVGGDSRLARLGHVPAFCDTQCICQDKAS